MEASISNVSTGQAETKTQVSEERSQQVPARSSAFQWHGFTGDVNPVSCRLFTEVKVISVSLGDNHSLFLAQNGQVFVKGSNDVGQLGLGSLEVKAMEEPIELKGLPDPVCQISCGRNHSAALTRSGQVFCWGLSKDGQCGTGSLDLVLAPCLVPVEITSGFCQHGVPRPNLAVALTSVACGASHTLALSDEGDVWAWGCGPQLGLGDLLHAPVPRRVDSLQDQTAVAVCCGDRHSLVLVVGSYNKSSSRLSSPLKLKGKTEAKSVLVSELYPSRCSVCNKEIYTYTDTSDMCVIDTLHDCNMNESIFSVDSTIIEEVSSSSSNEQLKKSPSVSPERNKERKPGPDIGPGGECEPEPDSPTLPLNYSEDLEASRNSLPGSSSLLENSGLETSVLVVADENPFEEEILNTNLESRSDTDLQVSLKGQRPEDVSGRILEDRGNIAGSSVGADVRITIQVTDVGSSFLPQDRIPVDDGHEQSGQVLLQDKSGLPGKDEISDSSISGALETEDIDEELKNLAQANRKRSPSTTSVKSFDLSGAREYLLRQFEDDMCSDTLNDRQDSPARRQASSAETSPSRETQTATEEVGTSQSLKMSEQVNSEGRSEDGSRSQDQALTNQDACSREVREKKTAPELPVSSSIITATELPVSSSIITATDVWVWGANDQGQLGLGDQLDRPLPTLIKTLSGRHVIKLAAGQKHSLAVTANSQVYSWGSNSYGQLGQADQVCVPTRIKFAKGFMTWDIAAGATHSVFLGDDPSLHPEVLYCGKQPSKDALSSLVKTSSPVPVPAVSQLGWITKVMAGGPLCACTVLSPPLPETEAVFELAASERSFYNQLIKTTNLLLRPLQKSDFFQSMGIFPFKSALKNLIGTFGSLAKKVGEGITDLTRCIQAETWLLETLMLGSHSMLLESFRTYSQAFSDFLAVGGFDFCTRSGSEFFEKIQSSIRDLSEEQDRAAVSSSLFLRAMRYPFFRLAEYSKIINKIIATIKTPEAKKHLENVVQDWENLKASLSTEHKVADTTRVFWESLNPKLTDSLKSPDRRMLKESKTHPLQVTSMGRFTSRLFVLFNDAFLMQQSTNFTLFPLETVWVESSASAGGDNSNAITIVTPEERLEVVANNPTDKLEWLMALNSAITRVLTSKKSLPAHSGGSPERFTPPLVRHASHKFLKPGPYKDAAYTGQWLSGKVHGIGTMTWADGSTYEGHFRKGLMHGSGTLTLIKGKGTEVQKGTWADGKLKGFASVSYANGDLYEGYFQDGQRFGHGKYQSGRHRSSCVSVYIGEWLCNVREGYGVQDDILKGEKYMGMWAGDQRQGRGVMVTLDGMYFEGNFVQDKLMGFGLMISDDNTVYEGEFTDVTHLSGKGTLLLSCGDKLEGVFSGTLNEGLKVSGTFIKAANSSSDLKSPVKSAHFGYLGVSADSKWTDIFSHTMSLLGHQPGRDQSQEETEKAWQVVAVMVTAGQISLKDGTGISPSKRKVQQRTLQEVERIPDHLPGPLTKERMEDIASYLAKACETIHHPLGQLVENLVEVFRASYIGIGAHPRLLHHAVLEMKSYIHRLYQVIRLLFPTLPATGTPTYIHPQSCFNGDIPQTTEQARDFLAGCDTDDPNVSVFTAAGLLYPILLPKIYPPLFDLYALYDEKSDDRYWERVTKLNRQSDLGLMAYLGIEQRFWLMNDLLGPDKDSQKLSSIKDVCYAEAVDTLQQLSTAFSPIEKLRVIEQTFSELTKTVFSALKDDHMWCMDDLFPIFQFVVVRAKIHHLSAEIRMIDDLMEPHLEHGELGLMFTTLKACYFQIQNEKLPHH